MKYDDRIMWNAVANNDDSFDGKFYYVVKTVGVYCKPSCKSRVPNPKNIIYFENIEQAETAGYKPCKRCRPDLLEYEPINEVVIETKKLIDNYFKNRSELSLKIKHLGVSPNHLSAIFKHYYDISPMVYLNKVRLEYAKKMLIDTDETIIDIALEVGFSSLLAFYNFFKKLTGLTPKEFRNNRG